MTDGAERSLDETAGRLLELQPGSLDPIGAVILAAASKGLCRDTRTFSREMGLAHALVIRTVTTLASEQGLVVIDDHKERSQRIRFRLTESGAALVKQGSDTT